MIQNDHDDVMHHVNHDIYLSYMNIRSEDLLQASPQRMMRSLECLKCRLLWIADLESVQRQYLIGQSQLQSRQLLHDRCQERRTVNENLPQLQAWTQRCSIWHAFLFPNFGF